ncbi:MAG: deoxynucleoside kinase [Betaproteobacteria bacterium]|nr:deoxynucleoside kinase [Betaproteobacteria bacterium]
MHLQEARYIVVEGPIGVGKTSLVKKLADHLGASTLLENTQNNPFLAHYYQDRARFSLPTQLFFLMERHEQLRQLAQPQLFTPTTVADFLPEKDDLFAQTTLNEDEYRLYSKVHAALCTPADAAPPTPDLVIFLHAPTEILARRVMQRARPMESALDEGYLARISKAYNQFFGHYDRAPVLTVNSAHLDFVNQEDDFSLLLQHIDAMRGPRAFLNRGL